MSGRLVIVPGHVVKDDRSLGWVDAEALARLYGVPLATCVVWDPINFPYKTWRPGPDDVLLYPKNDGRYELPARAREILG